MRYLKLAKDAPTDTVTLFGITITKDSEVEGNINSKDLKAIMKRLPYVMVIERKDNEVEEEAPVEVEEAPVEEAPVEEKPKRKRRTKKNK